MISITGVSWPCQRVFVLGNWLELPTETLCQGGLKDRQPSTAKWKCSTSYCPQPESIASHNFVERNVRPEKYQSRSPPADIDNQNATRHLFHTSQVKTLGKTESKKHKRSCRIICLTLKTRDGSQHNLTNANFSITKNQFSQQKIVKVINIYMKWRRLK